MTAVVPAWSPACMDAEDLAAWERFNARVVHGKALIPCADCPAEFSEEMRPLGRCNGTPRGGVREEEQPVDGGKPTTPARRTPVDVTAPPCMSCAHEPVCRLRATFEGAALAIEVVSPPVAPGLNLQLSAVVECEHYLRDRAKRVGAVVAPVPAQYWSPERRAAQAERMRLRNAAKATA